MLIACIFPRPFGARKNTTQLAKYPRVLYVKPSNKMYILSCLCSQGALNLQDDVLEGDKIVNAHFGQAIAAVGDLNADGFQGILLSHNSMIPLELQMAVGHQKFTHLAFL